jgi:two-component system nitrogen regulation sensor histidine kinase NtrY
MGYNRFYLLVVLNCFGILLFSFLCFYFLNSRHQPSTAVGMVIMAILLTGRLIFHVNRTNRILGNFLSYMQDEDPSLSYTHRYADRNFRGLNESLESLIYVFKENRIDLEVQSQYLETILQNVSTGILSFNESGEVRTMNKAARIHLGSGSIRHIHELDSTIPGLGSRMMSMRPREQSTEKIERMGSISHLSLNDSRIKLKGETIRIISLNDISNQMEEQEIESWKKLIRVINHEIMNSMTPIITLTVAIRKKLMKGNSIKTGEIRRHEDLEDAVQSAGIIEERSKALVSFINRYKKLTTLPPLKMKALPVVELFSKMEKLFGEDLRGKGIVFKYQADCTNEIQADPEMLEQVLINLLKNSVESLGNTENPEIGLSCFPDTDQAMCIVVSDNGQGIPQEKMEQVFVPFYTTREEGSGIGLSLCRQILRLHGGQISIESEPGKGTSVILRL